MSEADATGSEVVLILKPGDREVRLPRGAGLRDALFDRGVEFPCGGRGRCRGCRVKVSHGELSVTDDDARLLSESERADGWRLGCRARAEGNVVLDLAQWEATVLADETAFAFEPREGLGVAVDIGTTTLAGQILDLATGRILGVRTALNAQARHGADIMSRVDHAVHRGGAEVLTRLLRDQVGGMVGELFGEAGGGVGTPVDVVLVGNTVMHHAFGGLDASPLASHPFEPVCGDGLRFDDVELGWNGPGSRVAGGPGFRVHFLPILGSFVGSDLLAGVLATGMHRRRSLEVLVDLGTNGEIVVGHEGRLVCASTAAGPAFEAARIARGMRAATGAIAEVAVRGGGLACRVIGGGEPRGICGSGLVDAVAAALDLGWVGCDGRIATGTELMLREPVALMQADIRELQLAKGAIAAGLRLLLEPWGAGFEDVERVWLAGAFGNSINRASARRIGLLPFPIDRVKPVGNTALLGAKLALFDLPKEGDAYRELRAATRHVSLNDDPLFLDAYVDAMGFPDGAT